MKVDGKYDGERVVRYEHAYSKMYYIKKSQERFAAPEIIS